MLEEITTRSLGKGVKGGGGRVVRTGVLPSNILHPRKILAAEVLGPRTSRIEYPALFKLSNFFEAIAGSIIGVGVEVEEHRSKISGLSSGRIDKHGASEIGGNPADFHASNGILLILLVGVVPPVGVVKPSHKSSANT